MESFTGSFGLIALIAVFVTLTVAIGLFIGKELWLHNKKTDSAERKLEEH